MRSIVLMLLAGVLAFENVCAQNVGIGTNGPNTKLDVNGALSLRPSSTSPLTLSAGSNTITVGNSSLIKMTTSAATTVNATLTNGLQDGQLLTLYTLTTSGSVGITLTSGSNLVLTKGQLTINAGFASSFIWDASSSKWIESGRVTTIPNKQIFSYTGDNQIFTVPVGVTTISVKIWGAGGGPSNGPTYLGDNASGGSGGYVAGNISVTPLQNLIVGVGQGGTYFGNGEYTSVGAGASGGTNATANVYVGQGGGMSYIQTQTGTILAVAGGGGGAAGHPTVSNTADGGSTTIVPGQYGYGGAGGGLTGGAGGNGPNYTGGGGGTQSAGGAGGTGAVAGSAGGAQIGGSGATATTNITYGNGGGGGGGGYYGGGGGGAGKNTTTNANGGSGGGGGSSYVGGMLTSPTPTNTQGSINAAGGQPAAPNTSDPDYIPGAGTGGYVTSTLISGGGNGEVVISWSN